MGQAVPFPPGDLAGLLGRYIAVVTAVAAALLVLDAAPWLLTGAGRGVVIHRSVEEAERALDATLLIPAYFPRAYSWPPASVKTSTWPVRAAALLFRPAAAAVRPVLYVQTVNGDGPLSEQLLPAGREIHRVDFDLEGTPARMSDVLLPPDGTFHDVTFAAKGRHVVFRFQGDPAEVLKMAASLGRRSGG